MCILYNPYTYFLKNVRVGDKFRMIIDIIISKLYFEGGYKCECKEGTSLDVSGSICIDSRRGTCWRDVNDNTEQCEKSLNGLTLKSECCCSAIGVAWGSPCEKCDASRYDFT